MKRALALLSVTILASACAGPARPPAELNGLWSSGPASCAAGIGVRFDADAIKVVYANDTQTLFDHPRYKLESSGSASFRVRITYELPHVPGGARVAGAHGVLVLARRANGVLAPVMHTIVDARTGSSRLRIGDDPATQAMTLTPCGAHPWREDLRGREP